MRLARKRQVLGNTVGASYCETAISGNGLALSVCEYSDARAAASGRELSRSQFDAIVPGRRLLTRENTVLTLTPAPSENARDELAKIESVFAELQPSPLPP